MSRKRFEKQGQVVVRYNAVRIYHSDQLGEYSSLIDVGSQEWFTWLEAADSFSVSRPAFSYVARNEKRRGKMGYWYAFQKVDGKVIQTYIGVTQKLTYEKLMETGEILLSKQFKKKTS